MAPAWTARLALDKAPAAPLPLFKTLITHDYWNNADGKVIVETVKLGQPVGWPGPTTPAAAG